jgi:hypothetical protein
LTNLTGNAILGNSVFSNVEQGIDLGGDGRTANDGPGATRRQQPLELPRD